MMNRGEANRRATHIDDRNYIAEALDLIKGLRESELYRLFNIVIKERKKPSSDERTKELLAVYRVIKAQPHLEGGKLDRMERGYGEMAETARSKDGQTDKHRKKV